ncbi:MAG: nucleotide sugar dehydrogenase [Euryarchaeota archaeon]|nr:nucleotide sugar dehydrogenase [Euryarchaeota archaeon]
MIAVVGLGKAGLPLSFVIADSGLKVIGVDVDAKKCDMINRGTNPIPEEPGLDELVEKHGGNNLIATPEYEDAAGCDVFIVIVPLFVDDTYNPDFGILESAFRSVGRILKRGDLVVLETTVPPMTTETLARRWLEEESGLDLGEFHLAHSPERIMTGYSISRLREFAKVVGGVDDESGTKVYDIYKKFIANLNMVSSARVAEFIKLMEGCYRDVNIALANELFKISGELGINFYEGREYANHEYCHLHMPSTGVGGHCIPVYPWFLIKYIEKRGKFSYSELLRTSREINDQMIEYWAGKIILECSRVNKPLGDVKICIKGITFRQGVKQLYHSRNLALVKLLMEKGLNISVYDELFSEGELEEMGLRGISPDEADLIFDSSELRMEMS